MTLTKKIIIIISLILAALLFFSMLSANNQNEKGMTVEEYTKKVNASDKLVLVYFYADWCMPCKKLKPEIEALQTEQANVCEVFKIDADANPRLTEYFEINTLPMFKLYKNGSLVWENNSYQSKRQLQSKIETFK